MSKCQSHWRGQHKFEPRYDLGAANLSRFTSIEGIGVGSFMEKLRPKTYVHDVCVRCGDTINRPSGAS